MAARVARARRGSGCGPRRPAGGAGAEVSTSSAGVRVCVAAAVVLPPGRGGWAAIISIAPPLQRALRATFQAVTTGQPKIHLFGVEVPHPTGEFLGAYKPKPKRHVASRLPSRWQLVVGCRSVAPDFFPGGIALALVGTPAMAGSWIESLQSLQSLHETKWNEMHCISLHRR
jgi:hypothetical protein